MNRINCALKMARAGWPVFPLVPGGRLPYKDEGVSVATTDPARIRAWFAKRPSMNYGVCTTGAVVVDIDRKNGVDGLAAFDYNFGDLPDTLTVATPSGGKHLYFEHDGEGFGQAPLTKSGEIDVRSHNGYVVGPGSATKDGVYLIEKDVAPLPVPENIRPALSPVPTAAKLDRLERQTPAGELDTDAALRAAERYLTTDAPSGTHGSRNETGYRVACVLKDLGLSPEAIGDAMAEHWDVDLSEDFGIEALYELGRRAHKSGQNKPGARAVGVDFDGLDVDALLDTLDQAPADEQPGPEPLDALAELRAHSAKWFSPFDPHKKPEDMPPRRWFVDDFLMPGQVTGLVAAPGVGKSTLALTIMAGLAAGDLSSLGLEATEGAKRCLFLSTEEDRAETEKRAWAACAAHGINPDAIGDRLIIPQDGFDGLSLLKREGTQLVEGLDAHALAVFCHDMSVDVIVLDPWVEMTDAEENSNPEVKAAITTVRSLCRRWDMAGLVIHHARKGTGGDLAGNGEITRGAGALHGALRASYTLVRPSAEEMAVYGMSQDQAAGVFRMDRSKGSYSKPGRDTRWFKNDSVLKPNGDGTAEQIGAVVAYDMLAQETQTKRTYGDLIGAALVDDEADKPTIALKDAVAAVQADPRFGAAPPAKIKAALEQLFAKGPVMVECGAVSLKQFGAFRCFQLERFDIDALLQ